jgi:hypothetical protein
MTAAIPPNQLRMQLAPTLLWNRQYGIGSILQGNRYYRVAGRTTWNLLVQFAVL